MQEIAGKLQKLDPSVGSIHTLEDAVEQFANVPGFFHKDAPFMKVVKNGCNTKGLSTAKGAMYEVEKALELTRKGYKITGFEVKLKPPAGMGGPMATFDIRVGNTVIECKNWDQWRNSKFKDQISNQATVAKLHGFNYEIHSKSQIPSEVKEWLIKKNYTFFEG